MHLEGNTIVVTGGGSGIGLALAREFLARDNTVVICGRSEATLQKAQADNPGLHIRAVDVSNQADRKDLSRWLTDQFPDLNVLVNNAGIQREFHVEAPELAGTFERENEIETNITAPMHLTFLLLPQLLQRERAAIVNISSGLGLIPIATMPVYCATKAAIQSFSTSLRYQLKDTSVSVFDVAPPQVDTDLYKDLDHPKGGISPQKLAVDTLRGMAKGRFDIHVGQVRMLRIASRIAPNRMLKLLNAQASESHGS